MQSQRAIPGASMVSFDLNESEKAEKVVSKLSKNPTILSCVSFLDSTNKHKKLVDSIPYRDRIYVKLFNHLC